MTKRFGFTLAEVLITLGIIGVVAAMTMPTLMNSTQGAQYKAAYKKALSALSQAVTLNVALDDYNFADLDGTNYTLEDMLKSRMNVVRTETGFTNVKNGDKAYAVTTTAGTMEGAGTLTLGAQNTTLFFNDGIMFSFDPNAATECSKDDTTGSTTPCYGFIDVNGVKAPNKMIQCDKGTPTGTGANTCQSTNPTDVYPVVFYDQTMLPNSPAARAVLYAK